MSSLSTCPRPSIFLILWAFFYRLFFLSEKILDDLLWTQSTSHHHRAGGGGGGGKEKQNSATHFGLVAVVERLLSAKESRKICCVCLAFSLFVVNQMKRWGNTTPAKRQMGTRIRIARFSFSSSSSVDLFFSFLLRPFFSHSVPSLSLSLSFWDGRRSPFASLLMNVATVIGSIPDLREFNEHWKWGSLEKIISLRFSDYRFLWFSFFIALQSRVILVFNLANYNNSKLGWLRWNAMFRILIWFIQIKESGDWQIRADTIL